MSKRIPMPFLRRCAAVLAVLAAMATVAGCQQYRLGTTLPPGVNSVHVPAFNNASGEPDVETVATQAAIRELQRDGTLRLADAGAADAVLEATIVGVSLEPLSFETQQATAAREYRMRITADIVLKRTRTGEVMVQRRVQGETTFFPVGDLSAQKRRAMPDAAQDLAHDIVESIVEFW